MKSSDKGFHPLESEEEGRMGEVSFEGGRKERARTRARREERREYTHSPIRVLLVAIHVGVDGSSQSSRCQLFQRVHAEQGRKDGAGRRTLKGNHVHAFFRALPPSLFDSSTKKKGFVSSVEAKEREKSVRL